MRVITKKRHNEHSPKFGGGPLRYLSHEGHAEAAANDRTHYIQRSDAARRALLRSARGHGPKTAVPCAPLRRPLVVCSLRALLRSARGAA